MRPFLRVFIMWSFLSAILGFKVKADGLPKLADLPSIAELPDPLMMQNGDKVTSKDQWQSKRVPELKDLFQNYMYGYFPPKPEKIESKVLYENREALGGKAMMQEIEITVGPAEMPKIRLLLVVPNKRKGPAPVFVGMNFCGNHALTDDPKIAIPTSWMYPRYPGVKENQATEEGRGKQKDVWNLEYVIDRGYAIATFYNGDIDPDRADKREGIRPFLPKRKKVDSDCATIAAWAWGIHRVVDYLIKDKDIDNKKIVCVGHSRLGKTALLATAFDDRIAIAMPHQAGCGGTAPSRGKIGESVKQINERFPHWFCGNFKLFNDKTDRIPFDQHSLVALCAPRPVLFTNAQEDTWANPDGQFQVLKAAEPVYKLLETGGLEGEKPELNKLIDSQLGYFIRPGKHSMIKDDWKVFIDYADKWLNK
jgi:hypothetical protein